MHSGIKSIKQQLEKHEAMPDFNSIIIAQDGEIVHETYKQSKPHFVFNPGYTVSAKDKPHFLMSVTKTLTGVATARAMQLGLFNLTTPVVDIVKVDKAKVAKGAKDITIHDCLNMMSGIVPTKDMKFHDFTAADILTKTEAPVIPNKEQLYQDADPQLMWFSIDHTYKGGAIKFLEEELLKPLGIKTSDYDWLDTLDQFVKQVGKETSGVPKGGTGGALRPRDMIKVGTLMLNNGKLNGEQFLHKDYIKTALDAEDTKTHWTVGDYRYHWHHATVEGKTKSDDIHYVYSAGGMGQFIMIVPGQDFVMVATSADDNMMDPTKTLFREAVIPALMK